MISTTIHIGDALEVLRTLPDESVHCVVTSPPYWGLRDYGVDGQIGLEETFTEFLARLVEVFREVRRVLRDDGTCWVNMGDSYAGSWGSQGRTGEMADRSVVSARQIAESPRRERRTGSRDRTGLAPKNLLGQPWRLAFALQDDGWILRQQIVWHKPSPMPESVRDRCTRSHESVFMFAKSPQYHYDGDAIREKATGRASGNTRPKLGDEYGRPGSHRAACIPFDGSDTRNARSVWTIRSEPFPEAHFATFPSELPRRCIAAGCPEGGVVLDPFGGAGTTALVANRLGRDAILIELSPEYAAMAAKRIRSAAPLFYRVTVNGAEVANG